jgi:hypothetical protein
MRLSDEAKAQFLNELEALQNTSDFEYTHARADDILCQALSKLGYEDIVAAWDEVGKWYA